LNQINKKLLSSNGADPHLELKEIAAFFHFFPLFWDEKRSDLFQRPFFRHRSK